MAARNKHTAPEQFPYQGLLPQFRQACLNLCRHSLPDDIWHPWRELIFQLNNGEKFEFPIGEKSDEKLAFIDHYLFSLLAPQNVTPPNRNMIAHWRADLNKYRGWLLHRLLQQLDQQKKSEAARQTRCIYTLPEDLPKIVDDLYLFYKHIKGKEANIFLCQNLDALGHLVAKYRPKYPLSHADRASAHARFMQTETPEELDALLPVSWRATKDLVITDQGQKIVRQGGAKFIAALDDGTEVIQLLTEDASRAYGSPRWCTTYGHFKNYKDNLLVILFPDGQRWQLHYASRQFNDAADMPVEFEDFLKENPLLAPILRDCFINILQEAKGNDLFETTADLIGFIKYMPDWQQYIPPELPNKNLRDAIEEDKRDVASGILLTVSKIPAWQPTITAHLREYLLFLLDGEDYLYTPDRERALRAVTSLPEWRDLSLSYMPEIFDSERKKGRKGAEVFEAVLKIIAEEELEEWPQTLAPAIVAALSSSNLHPNIRGVIFEYTESPTQMSSSWQKAITPYLAVC